MVHSLIGMTALWALVSCGAGGLDEQGRPQRNLRFGIPILQQTAIEDGAGRDLGPGEYVRHLSHGGYKRYYEVHVPPQYKPGTAVPVVLVFHGGAGQPTAIRWQSKMDAVADKHGFLAVYPAGTGLLERRLLTWNAGGGAIGYAAKRNVDDLGFVRAMLDDLEKHFTVDKARVYATGLSNGAQMSYMLACELSDRIAAIAPVGATMSVTDCRPAKPVSVMHFHGLHDRNVPIGGGIGPAGKSGFNHKSVADTIGRWVKLNGCPDKPAKTWKEGGVTFTQYGPGQEESEVVLVLIEDGGHTWPGGDVVGDYEGKIVGKVSREISASERMWEFFSRHSRKPSP